jgi:hypothetical protein
MHYQVKWQGTEETTWEPIENLEGVAWMVEELENAMGNKGAGPPGFEAWEEQMEDEYMQAEQNSIRHNQGLPTATAPSEVKRAPPQQVIGLDMGGGVKRGKKRLAQDSKVKETQSLPHDLTTESFIIKQAQKR